MIQGMTDTYPLLRILPEIIFTLTGVAVMVLDPLFPKEASRKPLGWLTVLGSLLALAASLYQYGLPIGTAYFGVVQTDPFSVFFHVLISGILLVSALVTIDAIKPDTENTGELFALMAFGAVGMLLMTCAAELLLVFIGLEISSISTYILAGFRRRTAKGPESAIKYFLLGSFATAFFLYGIALTYGATGTTNIPDIAAALPTSHALPLAVVGLSFILIGLAFKVSAAPFHLWTPDAYEGAPSPVVGLMSTAPKIAAFAVLLRIAYEAFPAFHFRWVPLLWIIAALSMTIGNLGALRQRNVKRMLAYSSIAHAGYLLVAFTALSPDGIAAASFYAVTYAAMNVGIFAVISHVGGYDDRLTLVEDYKGLAYRSPLLGGVMAFFLLSLIGIPFTGGFFGKFYVFSAAIHSGMIWLAIIGLLNSGIAVFYYLRLLTATYSKPAESAPVLTTGRPSFALLLALFLTVATTLLLGIFPGSVLARAQEGAYTFYRAQIVIPGSHVGVFADPAGAKSTTAPAP
uniref:NADH-quinone oxidoreductase subunit N n=1 Tax=Acidobacterium capsulatum TaxID=33075 RepID=A0A7V5CTT5_9BACT